MKFSLLVLLFMSSFSTFAQIGSVSSGGNIVASKMNELIDKINVLSAKVSSLEKSVMPVGSIVNSLLTLAQYQSENGDCWKLANGGILNATDELKIITGMSTIPDALTNGTFLRQAKSGRTVGSFEDEAFMQHTHIQNSHNHAQNAHNHHSGQGYIDTSGGQYGAVAGGGNQRYTNMSAGNPVARWNTSSTTATNQDATAINQNAGGTETRPKNVAVNMFVKVKKDCTLIP